MKTRFTTLFAAALSLAAFIPVAPAADPTPSAANPSSARPRGPGGPNGMPRGWLRGLDLTAEQRNAIQEIVRLHEPEIAPLVDTARAEREKLHALVIAPNFDEDAVEAVAARIADNQRELIVARARMRADIRKILTPEQQTKIDERRASWGARGGPDRPHRRFGGGPRGPAWQDDEP